MQKIQDHGSHGTDSHISAMRSGHFEDAMALLKKWLFGEQVINFVERLGYVRKR